LILTYDLPKV